MSLELIDKPPGSSRLRRDHVLNPVTALAFLPTTRGDSSGGAGGGRHCLLAGEDTDIQVYEVGSGRLLGQLRAFREQSIHGISVCHGPSRDGDKDDDDYENVQVLVWGGYSVTLLPGSLINALISGSGSDSSKSSGEVGDVVEVKTPDWIFDAKMSPFGSRQIALLTAHNEVVEAHVDPLDGRTIRLDAVRSPSRPILYSGNLLWARDGCALVAAGTVFGEIVVWKYQTDGHLQQQPQPSGKGTSCEVLFVFSGHEGSIFGIHISPEIVSPSGETIRLLATCSDDRTVRVWDITERHEQELEGKQDEERERRGGYEAPVPEARETGFGDNTTYDDSASRCVATAMGHISRIWHVEFAALSKHDNDDNAAAVETISLYSFGEDATTQKWNLSLAAPGQKLSPVQKGSTRAPIFSSTVGQATLTHQSTSRSHSGKHLWSRAIFNDGADGLLVATGGSDGKIALLRDESAVQSGNKATIGRTETYSLEDLTALSQPRQQGDAADGSSATESYTKSKNSKESFQRYAFISDARLIVVTNHGRIFLGSFGDTLVWEQLSLSTETREALSSYSVLEACRPLSTVFIGSNKGDIFAFTDGPDASLRPVAMVRGKIADIFCLTNNNEKSSTSGEPETNRSGTQLIVTVLGCSTATLLSVDEQLSVTSSALIQLEPGFVTTAAAVYRGHLILGSRNGVISILEPQSDGSFAPRLAVETKINDAVTSIVALPKKQGATSDYFLATCRDGKYRIYEIYLDASTINATLLQEASPPFGPLIEGAWFSKSSSSGDEGDENSAAELMLCGFRSTNAVVWNASQQREVATIDCGGAHRSFAYTPLRHLPDGFRFVFTKASNMHIFSQARSRVETIKPGSHGREIRAVSASERYIATAAEDTVIRVHEYQETPRPPPGSSSCRSGGGGRRFRCVAAIEKHATGIQTLRWSESGEHLFSSGGNEEFFVWKMNAIDNDVCPLGIACEAVFPDRSEAGDLRIMDFDVESISKESGQPTFCISMALSNSTVQSYIYSRADGFRLLGRRSYTGACLMQLRHLDFAPDGQPHILAAATDGHLIVYQGVRPDGGDGPVVGSNDDSVGDDANDDNRGCAVITRLHQSSLKSLDLRKVIDSHRDNDEDGQQPDSSSTSYLVVTGGDDNAIGFMHLTCSTAATGGGGPGFERYKYTYKVQSKLIFRAAHAAAITGIGIARLENGTSGSSSSGGRKSDDAAVVVSTGNDQRVKAWRVGGWRQGPAAAARVLLEGDEYSSVADSGDLEIFRGRGDDGGKGRFLVGGVGMEVWQV